MIEWQSFFLTFSVEIRIDIFATFDHHNLLAISHLRLDDNLRIYSVVASHQDRLNLIFFLLTKRNVLDCKELVSWMDDPEPDKYFRFVLLIIISDLELVINLLIVIDLFDEDVFLVEDFDRIASLITNDIMRDEVERFGLSLICDEFCLFLFGLFLPCVYSFPDT